MMDMLLWTDMLTMDTLHHPTATLPGKDTVIMDMLPWTDMLTMDTLRHPTATLPWTDMLTMDTLHHPTATLPGKDTVIMDAPVDRYAYNGYAPPSYGYTPRE